MSELLTTKEIQELLHVDRSTIYRMVEAGRLPAIKVGKQWRFPADQVDSWLKGGAVTSEPPRPAEYETSSDDIGESLPLDCAQLVQDAFAEVLGVMLLVTDMDGQPLTQIGNPCPLYDLLAEAEDGLAVCQEKWRELARLPILEPRFEPSLGGLSCARALVRVGNELKAMVVVFGVALEGWSPTPEVIQEFTDVLDVDPEELQNALHTVFTLTADQEKMVLVTIQRIADILAFMGNKYRTLLDGQNYVPEPS